MNEIQMTYQSPDFSEENIGTYVAFIDCCSVKGEKIAVFDPVENELKCWSGLPAFEKSIGKDVVDVKFKGIYIIRENVDLAFIPNEVYMLDHHELYKKYMADVQSGTLVAGKLPSLGITVLEIPDHSTIPARLLEAERVGASLSDTTILLEGIAAGYLLDDENQTIGMHFSADRVLIYYFDHGKFVFSNRYPVQHPGLFEAALEQLGSAFNIDFQNCRCLVSGDISGNTDPTFASLSQWLPKAQLADMAEITGDALVPGELMPQQHRLILYYLLVHYNLYLDR